MFKSGILIKPARTCFEEFAKYTSAMFLFELQNAKRKQPLS